MKYLLVSVYDDSVERVTINKIFKHCLEVDSIWNPEDEVLTRRSDSPFAIGDEDELLPVV